MRFKVGDAWFSPELGKPLMVELDDHEKRHLAELGSANRYACFDTDDGMTVEERESWMREGVYRAAACVSRNDALSV